ncbi:hypothetical protein F5Y00DRAFT_272657 [Daldinia vernicosa]|uniref:uncharacterized protein n=1 Tax=Daldinia vernicosa TaxID=114800 RepID=UPI0020080DEF|nr:uncharacterized protein F5Y00DRAFT_272657 [Daldinia vernicosa]KAI0845854.1 hypothetical protein F5Y00DRAFT_272657 [Daldinia vernicosa]
MESPNVSMSLSDLNVALPRICEECEAFITDDVLPNIVLYYFSPAGFFEERYRDVDIQCTPCMLGGLCGVRDVLAAVYDAPAEMFTAEMFTKLVDDLFVYSAFNYPETWHSLPPIVWKWRQRIHIEALFTKIELVLGKEWAIKFFRYAADVAFLSADSVLLSLFHAPSGGSNVEALRQTIRDVRKSMIDAIQGPEGLKSIYSYIEGLFVSNGYGRNLFEAEVTGGSPPRDDNIGNGTA